MGGRRERPRDAPRATKCADSSQMQRGVKMLPGAIWLCNDIKDSHVCACFGMSLINTCFKSSRGFKAAQIHMEQAGATNTEYYQVRSAIGLI